MKFDMKSWVQECIRSPRKKAMPILSFPGLEMFSNSLMRCKVAMYFIDSPLVFAAQYRFFAQQIKGLNYCLCEGSV